MLIGHARVSTMHQNLDRQLATLKAAGCLHIFKEKPSGREGVRRPQLEKAIDALGRAAAKKRGIKFGPKPKLAPDQEREVARMIHVEGQSLRAVAQHCHVGQSTIVRVLERVSAVVEPAY
jgi:DNA invertase Pin-like site-specific DNA recombinase